MSATVETRVEYDDRFRQRPELVRGAEAAMAYLDTKLGTDPLVPPPAVVRWAIRPLDPAAVELSMADGDDGPRAARVFPAAVLGDPAARGRQAADAWWDLLSERSRINMARLDRKIAAFAAELKREAVSPQFKTTPAAAESADGR